MVESATSFLAAWSNFYVMIGSSAAALTGLMFVVITLVTRAEQMSRTEDGIASFSTPTIGLFVSPAGGLFAIAGGVLLLVFIGIHNAWDIVTFLVIRGGPPPS